MKIQWLGHACFCVTEKEYTVVIDPFREVPGFPDTCCAAHEVLCSHGHFDHAHREGVTLLAAKESPFTVETLDTFHDEAGGALRGENRVHILRAGGVTAVHLGDLGHPLSEAQLGAIRGCDVLLIPVGGTYTVDGDTAAALVKAVGPKTAVPMHYRSDAFGFAEIDTVERFLAHFEAGDIRRVEGDRLVVPDGGIPAAVTVLQK